ncbi:SGNH/GDSL hydrolase family protein [Caulobacter sp. S45]|uniref:SGNH/GDSL hydrolase family protein n=1 Tax=Caulobacter sp. S45 TaxID=1641861 RepID=UPI001576BC8F|nr:SGNH/GDSL hydrolase family protein [Caulobacter sp. S45]
MQTRRLIRTALALVGVLTAAGCAGPPVHRYFQPTADQIGPEPNSYGEVVVPRHGLIVVQGDQFAYGLVRGRSRHAINGAQAGQASITISQALRKAVAGVEVENRGYPGDTVEASAARWASLSPGDLLILCYGYGDLQAHTPPQAFSAALAKMIASAHASGAAVFVVMPPTSADPLINADLGSYRYSEYAVAHQAGVEVFDASSAIYRIRAPVLKSAAQPASVYQAVAADMVAYIKVVAPPQTGQAGSGESRTVRVSPASAS